MRTIGRVESIDSTGLLRNYGYLLNLMQTQSMYSTKERTMQKIGFLGLGIMGRAMASNVLKAGYELVVYNRTREKALPLEKAGARVAGSPREATEESDVLLIMVTGPEAVDTILWGEQGAGEALAPGKTVVNMSSVSPAYTRSLAERVLQTGAGFIDAPVSGSKAPAEQGTLVILAGGHEAEVRELEPLLLTMGKKVVHCGEHSKGATMKMTVNLLLGVMLEGLAEAMAFGEKAGLSKEMILDTVMAGPMSCGLFQLKEEMLRKGEYPTQFPLKHMFKDLRFVLETAYETGASTPAAHGVIQPYAAADAMGLGDEDFAAVVKFLQSSGR
ncbi:MAG: NAD(P)-dependent oxidoreductase [Desulfovibrionales bacterium]